MEEGKRVGLWHVLGGCQELTHESRCAGKSVVSREGSETSLPQLPHDSSKLDLLSHCPHEHTPYLFQVWR